MILQDKGMSWVMQFYLKNSLPNEMRFLLNSSVLLFTSGIGILIYQNIDNIGHIAVLSILVIVTIICFYFCLKNSDGFKKGKISFSDGKF
jgi:uncharacterized membrane protein YobD (UPF0266 family)